MFALLLKWLGVVPTPSLGTEPVPSDPLPPR